MTADVAYPEEGARADARFASVDCVFFVIGAQKAGTTWLSHYLKAHPSVSVPEWKEHDYWNMVEGRPNPSRMLMTQKERRSRPSVLRSLVSRLGFTLHARRQHAITLALKAVEAPYPPYSAYADVILANANDKTRAAGEICPEYALLKAETFAKMAGLSSNVRFVFLMRDPVARFVSGVRHGLRKKHGRSKVSEEMLSVALRKQAAAVNGRTLALSRYDRSIIELEAGVPADRILYVFFEELFEQSQIERICIFLGVPFVPGKLRARANSAEAGAAPVRAEDRALIARALQPVYDFMTDRFGADLPRRWQESAALC